MIMGWFGDRVMRGASNRSYQRLAEETGLYGPMVGSLALALGHACYPDAMYGDKGVQDQIVQQLKQLKPGPCDPAMARQHVESWLEKGEISTNTVFMLVWGAGPQQFLERLLEAVENAQVPQTSMNETALAKPIDTPPSKQASDPIGKQSVILVIFVGLVILFAVAFRNEQPLHPQPGPRPQVPTPAQVTPNQIADNTSIQTGEPDTSETVTENVPIQISDPQPDDPDGIPLVDSDSGVVEGSVIKVVDGDKLVITVDDKLIVGAPRNRQQLEVRLSGIDAPDVSQPYGQEAFRQLKSKVYLARVRIQYAGHDRYGQAVGEVYIGRTNVNVEMVREGFAWWYQRYAPQSKELEQAESEAKKRSRGMWGDVKPPEPPWEYRKRRREAKESGRPLPAER